VQQHPHLDYGYAVTSHSSQGQTCERVLVHADTEQSQQLVNSRMAYVSVSRAQYDAHIYTNDRAHLGEHLERDVSHRTAMEPGHSVDTHSHSQSENQTQHQEHSQAQGQGMGM
jgi:ATP-dependent exoDNAse (exonuclease V) alpha subunit